MAAGAPLAYRLVHTGQHYDSQMSEDFIAQLGIPESYRNLEVGSGTQAEQTGSIMTRYEALLLESRSALCLVVGDVTSTMACAIAAQKLCVPVAHVEAGIRSGDWTMPKEINRMVTDAITNLFFTTSEVANQSLRRSGVPEDRIHFVGNTMIATLLANQHRFTKPPFWFELGLDASECFVTTLHRPASVDRGSTFAELLQAIAESVRGMKVVFPVHPRTSKTMREVGAVPWNVLLVDPQPYLEFNYLVKHAKGGITEETTVMGVACMTLRTSTERPETVTMGTNELLGVDPKTLKPALDRLFAGQWKRGRSRRFGTARPKTAS